MAATKAKASSSLYKQNQMKSWLLEDVELGKLRMGKILDSRVSA